MPRFSVPNFLNYGFFLLANLWNSLTPCGPLSLERTSPQAVAQGLHTLLPGLLASATWGTMCTDGLVLFLSSSVSLKLHINFHPLRLGLGEACSLGRWKTTILL